MGSAATISDLGISDGRDAATASVKNCLMQTIASASASLTMKKAKVA
jgi:hypothetical protein